MRSLLLFFILIGILCLSCETSTTTTPNIKPPIPSAATKASSRVVLEKTKPSKPNCPLRGSVLAQNQIWLPSQSTVVCISADSSTFDATFGDSHRILSLYDAKNCEPTLQLTLPVNKSPDYPYYLADKNYNNTSSIVAIKGVNIIYCLDVAAKKMLPALLPTFKKTRPIVDAQSGTILRLELWEEFIIGYAQDQGVFVFKVATATPPQAIMPFAEYKIGDNKYNSLFLLPSSANKVQAILPSYDWEEDRLAINPLFKAPVEIQQEVGKGALNNQYLVLREKETAKAIGLDLKKGQKIDLPDELQSKEVNKIVTWMSKRVKE